MLLPKPSAHCNLPLTCALEISLTCALTQPTISQLTGKLHSYSSTFASAVGWCGVGWDVNVPSHAHQNGDDARLQHACLITWCYAGTCSPTWCYAGRLHQAYPLDATPEHVFLLDAMLQHARQRQSAAFTPTHSHMQCNVPATQYWSVLLQVLAQSKSSAQARENPSAQGREKSSAQASARPTFDVMA